MECIGRLTTIEFRFTDLTAHQSPAIHMLLVLFYPLVHVFLEWNKFPLIITSFLLVFYSFFFTLDHVLDESCTNGSVYELVVRDIIHAAVEGFNGMVLSSFFNASYGTIQMHYCLLDF